jgi:hypothetical protein
MTGEIKAKHVISGTFHFTTLEIKAKHVISGTFHFTTLEGL